MISDAQTDVDRTGPVMVKGFATIDNVALISVEGTGGPTFLPSWSLPAMRKLTSSVHAPWTCLCVKLACCSVFSSLTSGRRVCTLQASWFTHA